MNAIAPGLAPMVADQEQIGAFADALFRYADVGSFVSLRAFFDDGSERFQIRSHCLTDDTDGLAWAAVPLVNNAARQPRPVVFCPPIATFRSWQADEASLVNGLALSVECDKLPAAARAKLEGLLGPATVVVASGGEWTDPETGEIQDKLHLHWRLNEPTRAATDHGFLKEARALATMLVGGDNSNKPVVHPIRWPGSWHRKGTPRLARIEALQTDQELDLQTALERLKDAAEAAGLCMMPASGAAAANVPGEERETAELVRQVLAGEDYHTPLAALAMRLLKGGTPDGQAVLLLRGFMQAVPEDRRDLKEGGMQPGRWQVRYDDIPRAVSTARAKLGAPAGPDAELVHPAAPFLEMVNAKASMADAALDVDDLAWVDPATIQGPPPEREWIVEGWLPAGKVTSLYGAGGVGKSLLAQQLQTALALGEPFLGLPTTPCRSAAIYCEDDDDELHRRQVDLCSHYGAGMDAIGDMRWLARIGEKNALGTLHHGVMRQTRFFDAVRRGVQQTGAKLLILDNVAQLFSGNENDREAVTHFVNDLHAMAKETGAAILLLGHPGKADDSQYSGSTAWDNAVRSRWILHRTPAEAGEPADMDKRVLRKAKANYGVIGDEIALRWTDGAFQVEGADTADKPTFASIAGGVTGDEHAFLACLDELTEQGRGVSDSAKRDELCTESHGADDRRRGGVPQASYHRYGAPIS